MLALCGLAAFALSSWPGSRIALAAEEAASGQEQTEPAAPAATAAQGEVAPGQEQMAPASAESVESEPAPTQEETQETLQTPTEPKPAPSSQIERGGLLLGRGKAEIEKRLSYVHFSRNVIFIDGVAILPVLVVGEVAVERIRRDVVVAALTGRYGLGRNLQIELKVPYRYQGDRSAIPEAQPPRENTLSDRGLGDIEAALFYQLPTAADRPTQYILGLRVKSRTGKDVFEIDPEREHAMGSGFVNGKASLTAVRVTDPAVLFGTIGVGHNFPRRNLVLTFTDFETGEPRQSTVSFFPGNTIEGGMGMAYALNPRLSVNGQFSASWTRATKVETLTSGGRVPVTGTTLTVGSLRFGTAWAQSQTSSLEISVEIGLTDDAPDMTIELRRSERF